MEDLRREGFWQFRLFGFMFGIFGAAALVPGRRRRLRRAVVLGVAAHAGDGRAHRARRASNPTCSGLVVRQGVTLAAVGVVLGLIGAFGITRVIRSLLYNVTPTDPLSFGGVALVPGADRRRRELSAGAARDQRRSDRRPQKRVT